MPFTFSHPAIVLPLKYFPNKWFSLTGLVIGSLAPDFEYFLRMRIKSNFSHTLEGFFWFDLPLAILLAFIFHNIVRNSLILNLPKFLKSRFSDFTHFNWNTYFKSNWLVVIISILIGVFSHIFWDSFTHDDGYFVSKIPFLQTSIESFNVQIPILKILQHSSTLIGAFIIAYTIYKLPAKKIEQNKINLKYWLIFTMITFLIVSIRFLNGLEIMQYGNVIVSVISAIMASLILTPLIAFKKILHRNK